MSLINYVEPVSIGEAFLGISSLVLTCTIAYILYRVYIKLCQWFDLVINKEAKYEILEEKFLDEIGNKKGINLDVELLKRKMINEKKPKSLRKRLEEEVYAQMFPEKGSK